jgi:hypothetical protein
VTSLATRSSLGDFRASPEDLLAARRKHCLQCLDPVVRRLEEEILHDGLGFLELVDEHLRVRPTGHRPADLRYGAISTWLMQNDDGAPFPRLHEIRGTGGLSLGELRGPSVFRHVSHGLAEKTL